MGDAISKEERSRIMKSVKSSGNKSTELKLIEVFKDNGIKGWRRNFPLHGKPDFVFPKERVVVFADGCFWHGHDCRNTKPKDNEQYWKKKIERNQKRDFEVVEILKKKNWKVFRIWECEIKRKALPEDLIKILKSE